MVTDEACCSLSGAEYKHASVCHNCTNTHVLTSTCRGLEKALDRYAQPSSAAPASEADAAADGDQKGREAKRSSSRESRKKAMKNLSVPERDVLLVLGAICKVRCCVCCLLATACAS